MQQVRRRRRRRSPSSAERCLSDERAGKCFRLYPENRPLPAETRPHIVDSDITSTVLFLQRMELTGPRRCHFVDRPGRGAGWRSHSFRTDWMSHRLDSGAFCCGWAVSRASCAPTADPLPRASVGPHGCSPTSTHTHTHSFFLSHTHKHAAKSRLVNLSMNILLPCV